MIETIININKAGLNYLNSFADNDIVKQITFIFADAPIFFLPIFLLGYWIYYTYKKELSKEVKYEKKSNLLFIFYGVIISIVFALLIQQFVDIDRPEKHLVNSANLILNHIPDTSFPSDHAVVSFAFLAGLFFAGYKKIGYIFLPFVLIMNISRIVAGVHWPFDIIVGAIIGIIGSYIAFSGCPKNKIIKKFNKGLMNIMRYIKL